MIIGKNIHPTCFRYRNYRSSVFFEHNRERSRLLPRAFTGYLYNLFSSLGNSEEAGGYQQEQFPNPSRGQAVSLKKAEELVFPKIEHLEKNKRKIFLGIGQYSQDPKRDRIVLINHKGTISPQTVVEPQPHETLLDCCLETENVDIFLAKLEKLSNDMKYGEINSVGNGEWNYGFTIRPDFMIFSKSSWICNLAKDKLKLLLNQKVEEVNLADIQSMNVHLSEEPWNEQGIDVQLKNDTFMNLVHFCLSNDHRDLATLMVDTEWTVKAAALLCLNMKRLGHKVDLKLPKYLTIQGNPWVENRHQTWTRLMLSAN